METIILASSSPRRQEILKSLDIPFKVIIPNCDESIPSDMKLEEVPEYLAARKVDAVARAYSHDMEISWILGADTAIISGNKILGKPKDQEEAFKFMKKLQGKTHKVVTGLALFNGKIQYLATRRSINKVTFAPMSDEEISWLISTGEWHGVAGGYRIQGKASYFISKIEGSNSGVVGLPIFELYDMLKEQGYSILN